MTDLDDLLAQQAPSVESTVPRYRNRELSWLSFNERVLALAEDPTLPLLERAKFLAIFSGNLDEFFQVRVAALRDQLAARVGATSPDDLAPADQLRAIRSAVERLLVRQGRAFLEEICPALGGQGVVITEWAALDEDDRSYLDGLFEERIFPVLTPLAVDPGHPFPYISNLSLNLAVSVHDPDTGAGRFARLKIPPLLPRFVALPDGQRFVPVEQVIAAHLGSMFPGMEIERHDAFRVTRNADPSPQDDEADDLLAAVELELRQRRFGRAVRLEVVSTMAQDALDLLMLGAGARI